MIYRKLPRRAGAWGILLAVVCASCGSGTRSTPVHFDVIGDYGTDDASEKAVADAVLADGPDFVATVGDNNYTGSGAPDDWRRTQEKYYGSFLPTRFFPALGNHDWDAGLDGYLAYFRPPDNGRYYSVRRGPVALFFLDSDPREPDGIAPGSVQESWLRAALAGSDARWKLVLFHHPAHTSLGTGHPPSTDLRWDFAGMGASAVLMGHNHFAERLEVGGIPYFVDGGGGQALYTISTPDPTSRFRNDRQHTFLRIDADESRLRFTFRDTSGAVLDERVLP
jgi:tartrate-resistant acid phosphatase type 5